MILFFKHRSSVSGYSACVRLILAKDKIKIILFSILLPVLLSESLLFTARKNP